MNPQSKRAPTHIDVCRGAAVRGAVWRGVVCSFAPVPCVGFATRSLQSGVERQSLVFYLARLYRDLKKDRKESCKNHECIHSTDVPRTHQSGPGTYCKLHNRGVLREVMPGPPWKTNLVVLRTRGTEPQFRCSHQGTQISSISTTPSLPPPPAPTPCSRQKGRHSDLFLP